LDEKSEPCIQCALLYTTSSGERRIRVHTLAIACTAALGNIFRSADCDAILNYFARTALNEVHNLNLSNIRSTLIENCVNVLCVYRKFCATSTSAGQLILPESLKLLPVYILALIKHAVLRPAADVTLDERAYLLSMFNSIPVILSTPFIYPRMYALHQLPQEAGTTDSDGHVKFPPTMRLSTELLNPEGAFLLEDGHRMFLWLGKNISPTFLSDVFGISGYTVDALHVSELSLLPLNNDVSTRIQAIIESIRKNRPAYQSLQIFKQGEPLEQRFFFYLVEDKAQDAMSYVDFLCHIHKQIQHNVQ
jgi:protein transport protein SEC24